MAEDLKTFGAVRASLILAVQCDEENTKYFYTCIFMPFFIILCNSAISASEIIYGILVWLYFMNITSINHTI